MWPLTIKQFLATWTQTDIKPFIPISDQPGFIKNLSSQSIIIVGNGPSAIGQDKGSAIDAFDSVVRINNYVTKGLESQVGSRTDIWVNGANQGLKKRFDFPDNILVMIPPVVLDGKGDAIHRRIQNRLGTAAYTLLAVDVMSEMEASCGIERPTTGFFSIYFFYLLGLDVTLHGFDFFVGSKVHYFDGAVKRWFKDRGIIRKANKHDVGAEKKFVEDLIQRAEIKLLQG